MKKAVFSLMVVSFGLIACGSKESQDGYQVLTPRFDPGHFRLIECKSAQGKLTLAVNMIIDGDEITGITIDDKENVFPVYDFVAAKDRETDEGIFTEVELAKREKLQMAVLSWNVEQGIVFVKRPGETQLDWTGCGIKNQRVWESLSLPPI